ncbi:hypothetical protein ACLOJK_035481 [Asimina triloba]
MYDCVDPWRSRDERLDLVCECDGDAWIWAEITIIANLGNKLSGTRKKATNFTDLVWANDEKQRANDHSGLCAEKKKGKLLIALTIGNEQEAISLEKSGETEMPMIMGFSPELKKKQRQGMFLEFLVTGCRRSDVVNQQTA